MSTVEKPSADYNSMTADWHLVRALWGGTKAMRLAADTYLPKEPREGTAAYQIRVQRSTLFNGFRRTVKSLVGKPFSKPVTRAHDMPAKIDEWADDIDLAGRDLTAFARDLFEDAMQAGLSHILVDYPRTPTGQTLADERQSGARPYWVHVKAENLIGWKFTNIAGVLTLTQIRILDHAIVPSDFEDICVPQIRVIEPGKYRLFQPDTTQKDEWKMVEEGVTSFTSGIPLATIYTCRTGFMTAAPPLLDLAYLNVEHWQSSSDQAHILHVARVPLLFGTGFGEDENGKPIEIGPNRLITAPHGAELKYVEHTGNAIESGRTSLLDLEDRMSTMGMELLVRKPGDQTATAKAIDTAESDSELHGMIGDLKAGLERALGFTAQWAKIGDGGGTISINTDFGVSMREATEIDALLKARQAREISRYTFLAELARRGVFNEEFKVDEEVDRLAAEGPDLGTLDAGNGDGTLQTGPAAGPQPAV